MDEFAQEELALRATLTIQEISEFLENAQFAYCIIGGGSLGFFSLGRFTKDLDFKVKLSEVQWLSLKHKLENTEWITDLRVQFASEPTIPDLIQFKWKNYPIDFLIANIDYQDEIIRRSQKHLLNEIQVPVVTPEDLIILKLIANRSQDRVDIELLLKKFKNQLDMNHINHWCKIWEVDNLLQEFLIKS